MVSTNRGYGPLVDSGNGLSLVLRQAITCKNANYGEIVIIKVQEFFFFKENAFEKVVCTMVAILFRPQHINDDNCWHLPLWWYVCE